MGSSYNALEYNKLISFIWSVAGDCLRDVYVRGKYRDVIIPMTIIRRFDSIIEPHKNKMLEYKKMAEDNKLDVEETLNTMVELPFYNISNFNLQDLKHETNRQNLKKNFEEYLNGFSDNIKDILVADGVLFVEEYGMTRYKNFEETLQVVQNLNKNVLGIATYKL